MSRIGIQPIKIPEDVKVSINGARVTISGSEGETDVVLRPEVVAKLEGDTLCVERKSNSRFAKALHGTVRALLANAVTGVEEGHEKRLVLEGLGYRVQKKGDVLVLEVGFSHPVEMRIPSQLTAEVEGKSEIVIKGADKAQVGKFAAEIRAVRPPEPYKGKGIRYKGEEIKRKPGKAAKMGEGFGA